MEKGIRDKGPGPRVAGVEDEPVKGMDAPPSRPGQEGELDEVRPGEHEQDRVVDAGGTRERTINSERDQHAGWYPRVLAEWRGPPYSSGRLRARGVPA